MSFKNAILSTGREFNLRGREIHTERWQGYDISQRPDAKMIEVLHHTFSAPMPTEDLDYYRQEIEPNLPWADNHFLERVGGEPINPGVEHANWPWAFKGKESMDNGQYNHNYMERMWPKWAGITPDGKIFDENNELQEGLDESTAMRGIRHVYGDLSDVVELLYEEPFTRQAYLPIWFPEDTGVTHNGRKPCTLGWHFIMRDSQLDITYLIRSCDFYRHFRDDIYLAVRLNLWILEELRKRNPWWQEVSPGHFLMHITSLHMFKGDYQLLTRQGKI